MRTVLVAVLLAGCGLAAADHERLGDQAYAEGRYPEALSEYRAAERAGARPRVWAKLGAAALAARDFAAAVEAYSRLADEDPTRVTEAATGLERSALQAERGGAAGVGTIAAAVQALRVVAPGRPLGRFALPPARGLGRAEALGVLPAALASAGSARAVDSLLVAYGTAQRLTTACEDAARTFRTALRRVRDPELRITAQDGLMGCALQLGLDALAAQRGEQAERWFETVLVTRASSESGWRSRIGLGDARLLQGDVLGAAIAYQTVISATGVPDSLAQLASRRLNSLGGAAAPPAADAAIR